MGKKLESEKRNEILEKSFVKKLKKNQNVFDIPVFSVTEVRMVSGENQIMSKFRRVEAERLKLRKWFLFKHTISEN